MTDIFLLQSEGSYRIKHTSPDPEFPLLIRSKGLKQTFSLMLKPIFPQVAPDRVDSWEELEEWEPRPHLSYSKTMMMSYEDDFWPVSYQDVTTPVDMTEAVRIDEMGTARAAEKGSKTDLGSSAQTWGFILLIGGVGILLMLIVVGFLPTILARYGVGVETAVVSQVALPLMLRRRGKARYKEPEIKYETLVLLTAKGADRVEVPVDVLIEKLDIRCRYRPHTLGPWLVGGFLGLMFGPLLSWVVGFGISWFIDPLNAWLYGIAFSPLGVIAGPALALWWLLKSQHVPRPFWIAKRVQTKDQRFKEGYRVDIQPVLPREASYRSARSGHEVLEARDLEDKFTTGRPMVAQIALAGMATTLIAMVIIVFILVTMWQDSGGG